MFFALVDKAAKPIATLMPQATTVNTFLTGTTKKNFMLGAAQPNLGTKHQPCLIKQVPQQHQPGDTSHQSPSSFLPLPLHAKPRPTCCQTQSPNCYTSAKNLIMRKHHITKNSAPQFVTNTTQSTQPICHIAFHTILRTPSSPNIMLFQPTQGQLQTMSSIPSY